MSRRRVIAGLLATPVALRSARAQAFPSRPVRLIVPVPAGSVPDVIARLLAQRLGELWPVPVVVENRPGAGGAIGVEAAVRAPADGHTLLLGSSGPIAILPAVNRRLSYDPLRDLTPVARCADFPLVFLASLESGLGSFPELLDRARRAAEPLQYAGGDLGSTQHLSGALLARLAGLRLAHIPYRGPLAQADLIAGRLPFMVDSLTAVLRTIRDGKAIPLAVCGAQRNHQLPEVPTVAEHVPGYESTGWMGVFAPAQLPPGILAQLSNACTGLIGDPALAARILAAGSDPTPQPAAAFRDFVQAELGKWAQLAQSAGIAIA